MRVPRAGIAAGQLGRPTWWSYLLFRLVAVVQPVIAAMAAAHNGSPAPPMAAIALLAAQSAPCAGYVLARRRLPPCWLTVLECVTLTAEMFAVDVVAGDHQAWSDITYQYSLIVVVGAGMTIRSLPAMLGCTAVPAVGYAALCVTQHAVAPWNAMLDSVPYLLHSGVAWLIVGAVRRATSTADAAHEALTASEVELAEATERARHARAMHDRVLQTLEVLAHEAIVADPVLRGHVRAEAAWLRSYIKGSGGNGDADLAAALDAVAQDMCRAGIIVQLTSAQLDSGLRRGPRPAPEVTQAVADAVREALVNVRKHAGTSTAFVHARLDCAALTVTVLDHGRGFDSRATEPGFGITSSIRGRIEAVGGEVLVQSRPGDGTCVELRVPAARLAGGRQAGRDREPVSSLGTTRPVVRTHDLSGYTLASNDERGRAGRPPGRPALPVVIRYLDLIEESRWSACPGARC
jgi:signal transduction histidine kinase